MSTILGAIHNLIETLKDLIKFSKTNGAVDYADTLDILKNLFIIKENKEISKARFSTLIEKVINLCSTTLDGEIRAGSVFKTLVDIYPEDPHFSAHLARFYTLVEKDYVKGVELAKAAVKMSRKVNSTDSVLYHICGTNIRYLIGQDYKNKIKDANAYAQSDDVNQYIADIQLSADEALEMFEKSRISYDPSPGYYSAIDLCIDVIDIARILSKDSAIESFLKDENFAWSRKYLDVAMGLLEEWKMIENDDNEKQYNKVQGKFNELFGAIEKTVAMWEDYLTRASESELPEARRFLVRAKYDFLKNKGIATARPNEIEEIVNLMEQNIRIEPENIANIRIWFNFVRYCTSKKSEELLDDAVDKLSVWKEATGALEAYYYYFILICIKAIEGSSKAESMIPELQNELKSKSTRRYDNRVVYEWLGNGEGISRLKHINLKKITKEELDSLHKLTGIMSDYKNPGHALIKSMNMEIFFNPKRAKTKLSNSDVGKRVDFCIGFSYDGLRAYDQSVELSNKLSVTGSKTVPEVGMFIKCKVIRNIEYYSIVALSDYYNLEGSIHINELGKDFNSSKRPEVGTYLYATVSHEPKDKYWILSMIEKSEVSDSLPDWKQKLGELK